MLKENANTTFSNKMFNCAIMHAMKNERTQGKGTHPQMQRLYKAARELHGLERPADVARFLNVSQANLTNWASRGMSIESLLLAQEKVGCDAVWLRDGTGDMVKGAGTVTHLDGFLQITSLYWKASPGDQQRMLDAIKTIAAQS